MANNGARAHNTVFLPSLLSHLTLLKLTMRQNVVSKEGTAALVIALFTVDKLTHSDE